MKKRSKVYVKGLVFSLAAVLCVGQAAVIPGLYNLPERDHSAEAREVFRDVTGEVDFSDIVLKNLSPDVLEINRARDDVRTVIVSLSDTAMLDAAIEADCADVGSYASTHAGRETAARIRREQDSFLRMLDRSKVPYELVDRYDTLDNAVAIKVNTKFIASVKALKGVRGAVVGNTYLAPQSVDTFAAIGTGASSRAVTENKTFVYNTGIYNSSEFLSKYSGQGTTVAILDTGLDYTHPAFAKLPKDLDNLGLSRAELGDIIANEDLRAEEWSRGLKADDVYVSDKVPFAYDYADKDTDVYPSYSPHGTHVAGIVAGNDTSYTDKDGNLVKEEFIGVAPDAQLVICKVFTDNLDDKALGGAESEDILAALEDCVKLGVDVINMSLGTSCGFTSTNDGDDEGEYFERVYEGVRKAGISLICAASNDYSAGYGGEYGTNLTSNPDAGTVGDPSTYYAALSVASISGQKSEYLFANGKDSIFYLEASDENSLPYDFSELMLGDEASAEFEYVVVGGVGKAADYSRAVKRALEGGNKLVLVKRGDISFQEKVETAMKNGARGIIIYNNVSGQIRMSLGEIEDPIPACSITLSAGNKMVSGAKRDSKSGADVGKIKIDKKQLAGPFMSDFSSWGATPDLKLKPEITAHGGLITSTVPGGYDEMSGTSMASPNMAGFVALAKSYVRDAFGYTADTTEAAVDATMRVNQLVMSNTTIAYDEDGLAYSPRKQGAGLANLAYTLKSQAYLFTDNERNGNRAKVELGDDKKREGKYTIPFKATNFGSKPLSFTFDTIFMTETVSPNGLTVAEQAKYLNGSPVYTVDGNPAPKVLTIQPGEVREITVQLTLSDADKQYIDKTFENGMFVEGFVRLVSEEEEQNSLSIPFLGFYGDWDDAPMLDYTAYEIAAFQQDASIPEEEKPKASVFATQAYASYYHERYVLPFGSYLYTLPENADPMYPSEERSAISRYDQQTFDADGEESLTDYNTSDGIYSVYAGLLRNARRVEYELRNDLTGEVLKSDTIHRVRKAYAGGGSTAPALVELKMKPEDYGLVNNGKYSMHFEFEPDSTTAKNKHNTFDFSFYVDYEAPSLQDVGLRFYHYKENGKDKQRVYLDFDVYDNHYAQSIMLCYLDGKELKMATEFATPIRNAVKNGESRVSIEITDLYDKYRNSGSLYVQLDDYALNHKVYEFNLRDVKENHSPDQVKITDGDIEIGVNEARKLNIEYEGEYEPASFYWHSSNNSVVQVRDGEIVGLKPGKATVTCYAKSGRSSINVTVTDKEVSAALPSISFGIIKDANESLVKASGTVEVFPGANFKLDVLGDPWYYPVKKLNLLWSSANEDVATVDQAGNVKTLKKGTTAIKATVLDANGKPTLRVATVMLRVKEEFVVSNMTLTHYEGVGGKVVIPTDKNIMTIGAEAFKDNDNITEIVIPKTVTTIDTRAFVNCTALKKISFVSDEPTEVADADLTLINRRAFYKCTALETVDFRNVKTITIAREAFAGCTNLTTILDRGDSKAAANFASVGTAYDRAFADCTKLTTVDISSLHMSGASVFENCTGITSVETAKFTSIGDRMFVGCTALKDITIRAAKVGNDAFRGCKALASVTFDSDHEVEIGASAFAGSVRLADVDFGTTTVRVIGDSAFRGTALTSFEFPRGLKTIGKSLFAETSLESVTLAEDTAIETLYGSDSPFSGIAIREYRVSADSTRYASVDGVIYDKDKTTLLLVPAARTSGFSMPDTVTAIADIAFADNQNLDNIADKMLSYKDGTTVSLANIDTIGAYAFARTSLKRVELPANIANLGAGAFKNSDLAEMTFEAGSALDEIAAETFRGTDIEEIELPETVESLGAYAFAESKLRSFAFGGESVGDSAFADCRYLETADLGNSRAVGSFVFRNCAILNEVKLQATEMGEGVFMNANALEKVVFAEGTTEIGAYAFYSDGLRKTLKTVVLPDTVTKIETYAFVNCTALVQINLSNVTEIGAYAFAGCESLATADLSKATSIGDYAFALTALTEAKLSAAKTIGDFAFIGADIASLTMPVAETIGVRAFGATQLATAEIPATVTAIAEGAFSENETLTSINVAKGNKTYFAEDGVLYRMVGDGSYELVAYPGAKAAAMTEGVRTYTLKEGTTSVKAYAFAGLAKGAVSEVVFPYTFKSVGDAAFLESGVKTFTFNCISAPVLETTYRQDVVDDLTTFLAQTDPLYGFKGYFYSNYGYRFVDFAVFGDPSPLVMKCPDNGVGYDGFVYSNYFGSKQSLGVLIDDYTRMTKTLIESLDSADTVASWMTIDKTDENKAMVAAFAEQVKLARLYMSNIKDEKQLEFLGADNSAKLTAIESALRDVKERFGIPVYLTEIRCAKTGYKSEYVVGDMFDMTGLRVTFVYDDGSTRVASADELELVNPVPLQIYHQFVTVASKNEFDANGSSVETIVEITVTSGETEDPDVPTDPVDPGESGGCNSSVAGGSAVFALLALLGATVVLLIKIRSNRA